MDTERVDIIIFGVTGFTGKYVLQEFVSINENKYTWAIAGRNSQKLHEVLDWVTTRTGHDVTNTSIIISDCDNEESLNDMAKKGRIIINCCGPYRIFGEPVIKACIQNGTHHVDVSGEPEYMESIQLEYHEEAEKKGVYIVSACGFDSVPADLGVIHFIKNFPGQVNSIECYLKYSNLGNGPAANTGTWESAVHAFSNAGSFLSVRKRLNATMAKLKLEPRLKKRFAFHKSEVFNGHYSVPFPGSDRSVVRRTQMFLHSYYKQRPVQFMVYFICPSLPVLTALAFVGFFLILLTRFNFGKKLLIRYPEFFSMGIMSRKGPSEENQANSSAYFRFKGEGWSKDIADKFEHKEEITDPVNKQMITEFSFPSPAYGFTSKAVILSAFTILTESDKMPSKGGVYTPGGAFSRTSFLDNLIKTGVTLIVHSELSSDL